MKTPQAVLVSAGKSDDATGASECTYDVSGGQRGGGKKERAEVRKEVEKREVRSAMGNGGCALYIKYGLSRPSRV
jgi:hypothetical protein